MILGCEFRVSGFPSSCVNPAFCFVHLGMRSLLICLFALAAGGFPLHAEVSVRTDFEGGNAEVILLDQNPVRVRIMPALHEGRGWPCWWSLRLEGLTVGQTVTLEVQAQTRAFRPGQILHASWCQPAQASFSHDGREWRRTDPATKAEDKAFRYKVDAAGPVLHLAWGPPFVPAEADRLLTSLEEKLGGNGSAACFDLAQTRGGRPVKGIRIGSPDSPRQAWVQARQHAWEAGGSWVGRGFIEWLAGDDPEAVEMRRTTCVHFIPIMDVDNAALGAGGKEALPQDHNRDWSASPFHPEVAAAQKRLMEIHHRAGLDAFIDLHNPSPGDKAPFFFGPFGFETMSGMRRHNYQRWMELAAEHISGALKLEPRYRFATYVKTDEERARMSSGWAREHLGEAAISVTLETAWNAPESSVEGYLEVGAGLARTLARYLK